MMIKTLPHKKKAVKYNTFDLSPEEVEELKAAFKIFDEQDTGRIYPNSVKQIFESLGYDQNNKHIMKMFEYLTEKSKESFDETITFEQFLEACSKFLGRNTPDEDLKPIFELFCDSETNVL
jgi:Ca2+-binding EF-hand superfamily protein